MNTKLISNKKVVVTFSLIALLFFGTESASAAPTTAITPAAPTTPITPAAQTTAEVPKIAASISMPNLMQWVCKTIMTSVAVSAYVYTVAVTDGVMMVVAREVIRYMTVPSIVCEWFF